jgi:hypothetical protein
MDRRVLTALLAVLLAAPLVLGATATAAGATAADTPATTGSAAVGERAPAQASEGDSDSDANTTETGTYSIDELRRAGAAPGSGDDVPPSVRRLDAYSAIAVRYDGAGLIARENIFLDDSSTVRRDEVTIQSRRPFERSLVDEIEHELVIVYWQPKQIQVSEGNATRTETVASNQTVVRQSVRFGPGYGSSTVSLREHEQPVQVTMWLATQPDIRWRFTHHSTPFSESVLIDSEGDFWSRALMQVGFPTLACCAFAGIAVPASIRRAGAGPQWGLLPWFIILAFAAFFGLLFAAVQLSGVIVAMPFVVPLFIGGLVGVIFLERYEDGVSRIVFFRMDTTPKKTPSGDIAKEAIGGEFETRKVTKLPDGGLAVIPTGLIAFFARIFGAGARLSGASRMNAEIDLYDSAADKMVFIATDADDLVDVEREHFVFNSPLTDQHGDFDPVGLVNLALVFAAPATLFAVLAGPFYGAVTGIVGVGLVYIEAREGVASILPAVGQSEDAYATAMYLEKSLEEYETFEGLIRALRTEKNRHEDILEMIEEQGAEALIARAHDREDSPEDLHDLFSDDAKGVAD